MKVDLSSLSSPMFYKTSSNIVGLVWPMLDDVLRCFTRLDGLYTKIYFGDCKIHSPLRALFLKGYLCYKQIIFEHGVDLYCSCVKTILWSSTGNGLLNTFFHFHAVFELVSQYNRNRKYITAIQSIKVYRKSCIVCTPIWISGITNPNKKLLYYASILVRLVPVLVL